MHNTRYSQQAGEVVSGSLLRRSSRSAGCENGSPQALVAHTAKRCVQFKPMIKRYR